jgi:hypothetical protein
VEVDRRQYEPPVAAVRAEELLDASVGFVRESHRRH